MSAPETLPGLKTPLDSLHRELGARMVVFAGHELPLSFPQGILAEHRHCRSSAALFDVSHMGRIRLRGEGADAALESLMPADVRGLGLHRQRYGFFTNSDGGIVDDLMVTRRQGEIALVVNAAGREADFRHLAARIGDRCKVVADDDRALLALQGPKAVDALARLNPEVAGLAFMAGAPLELAGADAYVTRSGYTGEDGFEISVPAESAPALAKALLRQPEVRPAGLGARDTLRLEAGLCLHGNDIDETTTPVEAGLGWAIAKTRRPGGARAGGYPGASTIESQLEHLPALRRVGLVGDDRVPVRAGTTIVDANGLRLGRVTSGTLGPTVGHPIAMAYLAAGPAGPAHEVHAEVRGRRQPMRVVPMPFVQHRYARP